MPRVLYCIPCGERGQDVVSSVVIDGDAMCASCARDLQQGYIAKAVEPEAAPVPSENRSVDLCAQGCGKPKHRGRCKGYGGRTHEVRQRISAVEEAEARSDLEAEYPGYSPELKDQIATETASAAGSAKKESRGMDTLVSREIALEDIPVSNEPIRSVGRMGQLWLWLRDAPSTAALEVKFRDRGHLRCTHRPLRKRAQAAGIRFYWSAVGSTYYISKSPIRGGQKAWE